MSPLSPFGILRFFWLKFLLFFLSMFLFVFIPMGGMLLSPFVLYRFCIGKLCYFTNSPMLDPSSALFAMDSLHTKPKSGVVFTMIFKGDLELAEIQNRLRKILDGNSIPALKQCLGTNFGGFSSWRGTKNFQLRRHLKQLNPMFSSKPFNSEDVQRLRSRLLHKPFTKDLPLWELLLLNNVQGTGSDGKHSALFLRFHRCLLDEFVGMNFLKELLDDGLQNTNDMGGNDVGQQQKWGWNPFRILLLPFRLPIEIASTLVDRMDYLFKDEELPISTEESRPQFHVSLVDNLPMEGIQKVSAHFGVDVGAVILCILTGAVRELALRKYNGINGKFGCRSQMSGVINLPIGEMNVEKRLRKCSSLLHSQLPTFFYSFVGSLLPFMMGAVGGSHLHNGTGTITNLPGFINPRSLGGLPLLDLQIAGGLDATRIGFAGVRNGDNFSITVMADSSVLTEAETNLLAQFVSDQLKLLNSLVADNNAK